MENNDKLLELLRSLKSEQHRLKRYIAISWMVLLVIGVALVAWVMQSVAHMRNITIANTNAMQHMQALKAQDGKDGINGIDGVNITGKTGQQGETGAQGPAGQATVIQPAATVQVPLAVPGIQGEKGDKGDKGEPGEPGAPARMPEFAQDQNGKLLIRVNGDDIWQPLPAVTVGL